jgi:hypothetical protein
VLRLPLCAGTEGAGEVVVPECVGAVAGDGAIRCSTGAPVDARWKCEAGLVPRGMGGTCRVAIVGVEDA